ncbi:hypothetical protein GGF37_005582 [Kickxella alabastrina]|nr:hypothetical protein GGF37_005582 [Kickxella alabastrina]
MYKFGACPYEEKCDFIHNSSEAIKVPDHTLPAEDCNTAIGFTGNRASAGICNISSSSSRQRCIRVENSVCPVELERFTEPLVDICRQHSLPLAPVSMDHHSQLSLLPTTLGKTPPAPIGMERAQMAGMPQPLPVSPETIELSLSPQRNNFFLGSYAHGSPAAILYPQFQSAAGKNFNHPQFESVKINRVSHRMAGLPGQKAVPPIFGRDNAMGPADFGNDMVFQLLGEGERCRILPENLGNLNITNYKQFY